MALILAPAPHAAPRPGRLAAPARSTGAPVDFSREIRPVLAEHCFACHGFDAGKRQAGLRLDTREGAFNKTSSGRPAIVPGKPDAGELVRRITTKTGRVMPPAGFGKRLRPEETALLRRWITEGARYAPHWGFVPLQRPPLPIVRNRAWPRNPIDTFILARLEREDLQPSSPADGTTLVRRVTLDLTGLPPTPEEVATFLADRAPDAYEKVVERLLASPRYGERMAVDWLDAARYADTNGYQVDRDREMWPWRDWVIRAFNRNMPFDQFTIEQLAGDLLVRELKAAGSEGGESGHGSAGAPIDPRDALIATGFHRNHMLNEEGGVLPEEFLVEGVADRLETTATVWLGLTIGCARCHDHKYDPFTQKEYYQLFAFFNNVSELGVGNYGGPPKLSAPPLLRLSSPEQQQKLDQLEIRIRETEAHLAAAQEGSAPERLPQLKQRLAAVRKERSDLELSIPTLMVMEELPRPRDTFVLIRGQYSRKGEKVTAGTPAPLPALPANVPRNRLGLARWLVDPGNPLTARVTVNRFWQAFFGTGLVRTAEDFGSQGERPSHPELLDWLAVAFAAGNPGSGGSEPAPRPWDMKALVRLIVTSATYRQASRVRPELLERDPENRLLARVPRFRLPAEMIRDQALAASGLLVEQIGGPSVRPYHPPGLYEQVAASNPTYQRGNGPDLYRRSLYTYWRRSVPHPAMLAFDVPFRETCTVRRARTSTPLQALNLLNDPTYVEAARLLGRRMIREGGLTPKERITRGFRLLLARAPRREELAILVRSLRQTLAEFRADPPAAEALLRVGETPQDRTIDLAELAAYTVTANTLLNLNEAICRE